MAEITLHVLPPSHPCAAVDAALALKGLEYERVELPMDGSHIAVMGEIYGEDRTRAPGAVIDGEPVHGSNAIMERLDEIAPDRHPLFPGPDPDAVREAARWGDEVLQPLGRSLPWGALAFRPDALGLVGGGDLLDPAGTDFAMRFVRALWKRHEISCVRIAGELAELPAHLNHVRHLAAEGVIGDPDHPNAADLQIGSTLAVLGMVGDVADQLEDQLLTRLASLVAPRSGQIPAGAFPPGLLPGTAG